MRLRIAGASVGALLALTTSVAPAHAVSAQQAIAALNAQRAANGIPAGIAENPDWSEGCRLHERYVALNGTDSSDPHDEDPSKPGYTSQGQTAARNAVLGASFSAAGANGWETAPIHLMQTLAPALSVTGYADGCLWTWPGYQRPLPPQTELYTYPGDGSTIYARETAAEWPFVPGQFVGIGAGATTGPYLYVFAFSADVFRVRLTGASLTGPAGAVAVRTVDNLTSGPLGDLGSYLPPGGMVIPVAPLEANATYRADVTGESENGEPLAWSWSFRTPPRPVARTRVAISGRLSGRVLVVDVHVDPALGQRLTISVARCIRLVRMHGALACRRGGWRRWMDAQPAPAAWMETVRFPVPAGARLLRATAAVAAARDQGVRYPATRGSTMFAR